MEIDNVPCFLCHDTPDVLYKLCECLESNICVECYNIDNTQKMARCAICRRNFTYNYKRNYVGFIGLISRISILVLMILGIELLPPLYIYYYETNETQTLNNIFLSTCLFFIIFGNIIIFNFIKITTPNIQPSVLTKQLFTLYLFKLCFIIFIFCVVISRKEIYTMLYYTIYIIGLLYVFPILLFSIIFMNDKCRLLNNYINEETLKRRIKINSFIFQEQL
jgi:hypothetical protein